MGKTKTKVKAKDKRRVRVIEDREDGTVIPFKRKFEVERQAPPIVAMNARQAEYIAYLRTHPQVFVLGPAGTGKTWIAASHAADLYRNGLITKIILTRPNVPCGRSLGFFPGTIESKFAPWTVPVTDAMRDRLGKAVFDLAVKNGDIIVFDIAKRTLTVDLSQKEIKARLKKVKQPLPRYTSGVMGKYARHVSSASEGAITT